jgi:hypothetical protein
VSTNWVLFLEVLASAFVGWLAAHASVVEHNFQRFKWLIDSAWVLFTAVGVLVSVSQYLSSSATSTSLKNAVATAQALDIMQREAAHASERCKAVKSKNLKISIAGKEEPLCEVLEEQARGLKTITDLPMTAYEVFRRQEADSQEPEKHRDVAERAFRSDYLRVNRIAVGTKSAMLCEARQKIIGDQPSVLEPAKSYVDVFEVLCDVYREESERIIEMSRTDTGSFPMNRNLLIVWFFVYAFFAGARFATVTKAPPASRGGGSTVQKSSQTSTAPPPGNAASLGEGSEIP